MRRFIYPVQGTMNNKHKLILCAFTCFVMSFAGSARAELDTSRLSEQDIKKVESLLAKLSPLVQQRRDRSDLATMVFEELYAPLTGEEKKFLKSFQKLDAEKLGVKIPYRGLATGGEKFIAIKGQKVRNNIKNAKEEYITLPVQFLTSEVYDGCNTMMAAMQKDIGRKLYVESGYRSAAYQLYLFIFYLKNHNYSIRETAKFVALPGYSEHGDPESQAIDFINEDGIDGQNNPMEFEALAEYNWMLQHAGEYNFVLSYPKDSKDGIAFEPWHWRYEKKSRK